MLIPVTTDARFMRARGAVSYGVGLFDDRMGFGEMLRLFHGHDERVSIGSIEATTALLALTVGALRRPALKQGRVLRVYLSAPT